MSEEKEVEVFIERDLEVTVEKGVEVIVERDLEIIVEKDVKVEKKDIEVTIETTQGEWKATFPKTEKVESVIKATIQHFKFSPEGKYELRREHPDEVLKPDRTLASYDIKDHACLIFSEQGSAA